MARLVVSTQSLQVLAADQGTFTTLGYHPYEINGHNVLAITGARSDTRMLQSAIESMQGLKMQIILYDASGDERRLIVSCSPFYEDFVLVGCLLTIQPSEAVMLQEAFAECLHARALVSADYPHAIHMANDAFLDRFSCDRQDVLGQPLHFFSSINSELVDRALAPHFDADPEEAWSALLATALDGRVARWRRDTSDDIGVQICDNGADEVTCAPVVEAPNGYIRHIVVSFGPPPGVGSADVPVVNGCSPPQLNPSAKRRVRPAALRGLAMAATADTTCSLVCPRLRSLGHAIFPRRKPSLQVQRPRNDSALAPPVVVTRELIAALADLPLNKAAAAAGVSATAFKKACRKLGVRRWAYKRGRSVQAVSAALSGAHALGGEGAGLESSCASVESEGESGPDAAPATRAPTCFQPADSGGEPDADAWSSAPRRDSWARLCDDADDSEVGAAHDPQDAGALACSTGALTPAQPGPARTPIWAALASAIRLRAEGGDSSASGATAAVGQFLEEPAVDEALVREMLDMPWPLQA